MAATIMHKIRNFSWPVSDKMGKNPYFWHLIPLQNSSFVSFQTLWIHTFMQKNPQKYLRLRNIDSRKSVTWANGQYGFHIINPEFFRRNAVISFVFYFRFFLIFKTNLVSLFLYSWFLYKKGVQFLQLCYKTLNSN